MAKISMTFKPRLCFSVSISGVGWICCTVGLLEYLNKSTICSPAVRLGTLKTRYFWQLFYTLLLAVTQFGVKLILYVLYVYVLFCSQFMDILVGLRWELSIAGAASSAVSAQAVDSADIDDNCACSVGSQYYWRLCVSNEIRKSMPGPKQRQWPRRAMLPIKLGEIPDFLPKWFFPGVYIIYPVFPSLPPPQLVGATTIFIFASSTAGLATDLPVLFRSINRGQCWVCY